MGYVCMNVWWNNPSAKTRYLHLIPASKCFPCLSLKKYNSIIIFVHVTRFASNFIHLPYIFPIAEKIIFLDTWTMSVSSQIKLYKHSPSFFCVGEDDQPYALRMLSYKCVIDHRKEIELIQWKSLSKPNISNWRYCSIRIQMIRWKIT